jgi:hypothetical protein
MQPAALNLLVFRDDRRCVNGLQLKSALLRRLEDLAIARMPDHSGGGDGSNELKIGTLLCAGELECGMSDSSSAPIRPYASLTDYLARALVDGRNPALPVRELQAALACAPVAEQMAISSPEGFAHYALHPLAYAEAVKQLPLHGHSVAVVGIRSIGTTLSAITAAAARSRGLASARITVRPFGHPYNRKTEFLGEQLRFVRSFIGAGADFLVVDEGPGLSGSSFLSVAEALSRAGVREDRITMVCGHPPDFDSFCSSHGPQRARKFRWIASSSEPRKPQAAELSIGAGQWRRHLFPNPSAWPASWTALERLKYLSPNHCERQLIKFAGLGHYGARVLEREEQAAGAGFGLLPRCQPHGFASYNWIAGRPMSSKDLAHDALQRLGEYCAFRALTCSTQLADLDALQEMAVHNAQQLGLNPPGRLRLERPVIVDGRMQPHEWLRTADGEMLKADCGSHGDDHFFPGPTDIAWDLAGAIVEWRMNGVEARFFLESYRRWSGDDAEGRIEAFVAAYTIFRRAYCLMAANALQEHQERKRLERAAADYVVPVGSTV